MPALKRELLERIEGLEAQYLEAKELMESCQTELQAAKLELIKILQGNEVSLPTPVLSSALQPARAQEEEASPPTEPNFLPVQKDTVELDLERELQEGTLDIDLDKELQEGSELESEILEEIEEEEEPLSEEDKKKHSLAKAIMFVMRNKFLDKYATVKTMAPFIASLSKRKRIKGDFSEPTKIENACSQKMGALAKEGRLIAEKMQGSRLIKYSLPPS